MSLRIIPNSDMSEISELAVDASPSGLVVCDEEGVILLANRQIEAMFGYPAAELVGRTIDALIPAASRNAHASDRNQFWSDPETRRMGAGRELFGRRRDGTEVPVEVGLTVATRDGRRLVVASVVDVSERLRQQSIVRAATNERLAFERLISNIAARFVGLPPGQMGETITDSLRKIVETLDLDRGALWQFTENAEDLVYTHTWVRPGHAPPPSHISAKERFPWLLSKVRANEPVWNASVRDVPDSTDRENLRKLDTQSNAVIPLCTDGGVIGAISFGTLRAERSWGPELRGRLQLLATVFAHALARGRNQQQLEKALAEVERLRERLSQENTQLRQEVRALEGPRVIAAESPAVRAALAQIESVASTDATVLLLGETGTGKEVFAQAIHDHSKRRSRPMVRVNCAAIPTALIESELFGRERGAYTGALSRQIGRFELANGSTLFLDEIGELPLESQVKLLRVTQERVVERLGSVQPISVDVRLIAASNRDLERAVAERTFREDLYYRLNVFPITVPPLRERAEDIPVLVWTFIEEFSKSFGKKIDSISRESLAALQRYPWPGNVRELRNLIERAVIVAPGTRLVVEPPQATPAQRGTNGKLADVEAEHIRAILQRTGWRVRGAGGAAELLGMKPTTLDSRMAKLGIRRPGAR